MGLFSNKQKRGKSTGHSRKRVPVLESKNNKSRKKTKKYKGNSKRNKQNQHWFKRLLKKLFLMGFIAGSLVFAYFWVTLPSIDELNRFTKNPSILLKAENGKIIGSFGDIYGDYVTFSQLPSSLIDAVLATEDRNFFYHFGVDPIGLTRAMIVNFKAGRVVQGGSTITQQVAKNVFLTPERSFIRKFREMILAFKLEYRFGKEDIMGIYLNRVYLGAGNYGVDAASRRYFSKSVRDIGLGEAAILAGLLKAPSRFAPTSNPELSRNRAEQVLVNMQAAGYLNEDQTKKARSNLTRAMQGRHRESQSSMYFADWVAEQIPELIGGTKTDIIVTTTLDSNMQAMADKAIATIMDAESEKAKAKQAAMVSMSSDGAVRVMIGGRHYGKSQYNRAAQAKRQPGSSFKLFVYLAGLEAGMNPNTLMDDDPITVPIYNGEWTPRNYTGEYLGPITIREALTHSVNTVAVRVALEVGIDNVVHMAKRLGIASNILPVPSIALGSTETSLLEMTTAYAHLAAGGSLVDPYGILKIESTAGEVIYKRPSGRKGKVLGGRVVSQMNDMLMSVVNNGTGRRARINRPAAGKTGTTSDYRDALFIGYTADIATGVWVGNDDNTKMEKVTGGNLPAGIWRDFMQEATAGMAVHQLPTEAYDEVPLPWRDGAQYPTGNNNVIGQRGRRQRGGRDVNLGNSFWDKLFGR